MAAQNVRQSRRATASIGGTPARSAADGTFERGGGGGLESKRHEQCWVDAPLERLAANALPRSSAPAGLQLLRTHAGCVLHRGPFPGDLGGDAQDETRSM